MAIKRSNLLAGLIAGAAIGLLIFGFLTWRVTTVERASAARALGRFAALRGKAVPIIEITPDGAVARRERAPHEAPLERLSRLHVLVYHPSSERLAESRIPFWFFRLKAPAAQYALDGTGLDFERLGITAAELERFGPRVVIDHQTAGGTRVLIRTE